MSLVSLLLVVLLAVGQVDASRGIQCTSNLCEVSSKKITLDCGSRDEAITDVEIANAQVGDSWTCASGDAFSAQCGRFARIRNDIVAKCRGETECEIMPADVLPPNNVTGCEGAGGIADLSLAVKVKCEAIEFIDPLALISLLFIAFVMLAMACTLEYSEFMSVLREKKKGVLIGWASQFGVMPLMAFIMVQIAGFDVYTAAGVIMCGCTPGGSTSNLFTYWSGGDVALSIIMSAMSTAGALVMFPFLVWLYVEVGLGASESIEIPFANIFIALMVIVIPASIGALIRNKVTMTVGKNQTPVYKLVEKVGSTLGFILLITGLIIGVLENPNLFNVSEHPFVFVFAALFQPLGCLIGYTIAFFLKMNQKARIAVSLETGIQNYPVVLAVVALSFNGCDRARAVAFALLASLFYSVNALWVVAMFKYVPFFATEEEDTDIKLGASP